MRKLLLGLLLSMTLVAGETALRWSRDSASENRPKHRVTAEVTLVLVPVTVTDRNGRIVDGLTAANFQVHEDGVRHEIASFASEELPVSVAIVFDLSGSMRHRILQARSAVKTFLELAGPGDEVLLTTFADRPQLKSGFTRDLSSLTSRLLFERATGSTALLDAVYLTIGQMRASRNPRKAVLIISDGGDNNSRYSQKEVLRAALESDVQIYAIEMREISLPKSPVDLYQRDLLQDLAGITGGLNFVARNRKDVARAAERIGRLLRQQYVIGYRPLGGGVPGKWRKIRVTLEPPIGQSRLRVTFRSGYYDPH